MDATSILRLPDELIRSIAYHLPATDAVCFGASCRRIHAITDEPILWRHFCHVHYRSWRQADDDAPFQSDSPDAPWRNRFVARAQRDLRNKRLFESLLASQHARLVKIRQIASCEYETKDMLDSHISCSTDCDDVLARQHWARVTLGLIHRSHALGLWQKLRQGQETILEEQMAALDLFVIGGRWGDVSDILCRFDHIAAEIKLNNPDFHQLDLMQRALLIARELRDGGHVGLEEGADYQSMRNNYLSFNLSQPAPASRPLQSAVIYCAVARRLGVEAHPIDYPAHVYVVVNLEPDKKITTSSNLAKDCVYLDPWTDANPVEVATLLSRLRAFAIPTSESAQFMTPAATINMVRRACRNIFQSHTQTRELPDPTGTVELERTHAIYGFFNAMAILGDSNLLAHDPLFLREHYPEDVDLAYAHFGHRIRAMAPTSELRATIAHITAEDMQRRRPVTRTAAASSVKYRIGQFMRHRRYGYAGVVRGWSTDCDAPEDWIVQMRVDDLKRGRGQAFYHVLGADGMQRYVAEDNIQVLDAEPPPQSLLRRAGQYFKRWDAEKNVFVSNVRDEYPDD